MAKKKNRQKTKAARDAQLRQAVTDKQANTAAKEAAADATQQTANPAVESSATTQDKKTPDAKPEASTQPKEDKPVQATPKSKETPVDLTNWDPIGSMMSSSSTAQPKHSPDNKTAQQPTKPEAPDELQQPMPEASNELQQSTPPAIKQVDKIIKQSAEQPDAIPFVGTRLARTQQTRTLLHRSHGTVQQYESAIQKTPNTQPAFSFEDAKEEVRTAEKALAQAKTELEHAKAAEPGYEAILKNGGKVPNGLRTRAVFINNPADPIRQLLKDADRLASASAAVKHTEAANSTAKMNQAAWKAITEKINTAAQSGTAAPLTLTEEETQFILHNCPTGLYGALYQANNEGTFITALEPMRGTITTHFDSAASKMGRAHTASSEHAKKIEAEVIKQKDSVVSESEEKVDQQTEKLRLLKQTIGQKSHALDKADDKLEKIIKNQGNAHKAFEKAEHTSSAAADKAAERASLLNKANPFHTVDKKQEKLYTDIAAAEKVLKYDQAKLGNAQALYEQWNGIAQRFSTNTLEPADKSALVTKGFRATDPAGYLDEDGQYYSELQKNGEYPNQGEFRKNHEAPHEAAQNRLSAFVTVLQQDVTQLETKVARSNKAVTDAKTALQQYHHQKISSALATEENERAEFIQTLQALPNRDAYQNIAEHIALHANQLAEIRYGEEEMQVKLAEAYNGLLVYAEGTANLDELAHTARGDMLPVGTDTFEALKKQGQGGHVLEEKLSDHEKATYKYIDLCKKQLAHNASTVEELKTALKNIQRKIEQLQSKNSANRHVFSANAADYEANKVALKAMHDQCQQNIDRIESDRIALQQRLADLIARIDGTQPSAWHVSAAATLDADSTRTYRDARALSEDQNAPLPQMTNINNTQVRITPSDDPTSNSGQISMTLSRQARWFSLTGAFTLIGGRSSTDIKRMDIRTFWAQSMLNGAVQTDEKGNQFIRMTAVPDDECRAMLAALGQIYGIDVRGAEIPSKHPNMPKTHHMAPENDATFKSLLARERAMLAQEQATFENANTNKTGDLASGFKRDLMIKAGIPTEVYLRHRYKETVADDENAADEAASATSFGVRHQAPGPAPAPDADKAASPTSMGATTSEKHDAHTPAAPISSAPTSIATTTTAWSSTSNTTGTPAFPNVAPAQQPATPSTPPTVTAAGP